MAIFLEITGDSFGAGHDGSTTYAVTANAGTVTIAATGAPATGITKAELEAGIIIEISDNSATQVCVTVDNGVCIGEEKCYTFATTPTPTLTSTPTLTPTLTPTPTATAPGATVGAPTNTPTLTPTLTPTPTSSSTLGQFSLTGNYGVVGYSTVSYKADFVFTGLKNMSLSAGPDVSCSTGCTNTGTPFVTGTVDGTGTITVTRVAPDGTADDAGDISINVNDGSGISISTANNPQTFINGTTISYTWNISGWTTSEDIDVIVFEQ